MEIHKQSAVAASIEKPIHNVKVLRGAVAPQFRPMDGNPCLHIWNETTGGAYRDRTDDPLLAKQVLSQLS